ncbi:DUF4190 domain-containing protein [Actinomadura kijaniata]|uniref:DUF4190 domain-containing protein n=1 Tax=Actinomadura kijaniata TaxID=46161 RepID=UPI000835C005|nr:DUF4190 domain-containing protein [Actinomadura kijaniata]
MAQPPYDPYGQQPYQQPAVQHHYYGAPQQVVMPPTNGMAVASLICSIAGLFTCGFASFLGVIFGHVAQGQIRRTGEGGSGMAVAGLIIGYILSFLTILVWGLYIFGLLAVIGMSDSPSSSTY